MSKLSRLYYEKIILNSPEESDSSCNDLEPHLSKEIQPMTLLDSWLAIETSITRKNPPQRKLTIRAEFKRYLSNVKG